MLFMSIVGISKSGKKWDVWFLCSMVCMYEIMIIILKCMKVDFCFFS